MWTANARDPYVGVACQGSIRFDLFDESHPSSPPARFHRHAPLRQLPFLELTPMTGVQRARPLPFHVGHVFLLHGPSRRH